ncbi:hypothetical protein FA95DRAFT_1682700 [Auriscalpium vulgare]|uniref:Uncharacterized protein n=1 Tax=Auriscalpium vulgare TaxID=40419 RepID=A0ACB8RDK9_9AGAM|nr:hypothetical protein FA95DRAFT_1682700 [Auriscalpium vulgare]
MADWAMTETSNVADHGAAERPAANIPVVACPSRLVETTPPEILAHIFKFLADASPSDLFPSMFPRCWIGVTYVSRRWRRIALAYPLLWARICFTLGDAWTREMLVRAQATPLTIMADSTSAFLSLQQVNLLREHLWHTRKFLLRVRDHMAASLFLSQDVSAPLLEILVITRHWGLEVDQPFTFTYDAPRLRSLSLSGIDSFSWNPSILRGLVDLTLDFDTDQEGGPGTCESILSALDSMKALRNLFLGRALPFASHTSHRQSDAKIISLSRLTSFTVTRGSSAQCLHVLDHLLVPPTSTISIQMTHSRDSTVDGFTPVIPALTGYLSRAPPPTSILIHSYIHLLSLFACRRTKASTDTVHDGPFLRATCHEPAFNEPAGALTVFHLTHVLWSRYIFWDTLEQLEVDFRRRAPWTEVAWFGVLRGARRLRELVAHCEAGMALLEFFAAEGANADMCVPALARLRVQDAQMWPREGEDSAEPLWVQEWLPLWVRERARAGPALQSVSLVGCTGQDGEPLVFDYAAERADLPL